MSENIKKLNSLGQSIWYDNLSRDLLKSGDLTKLISQGVSGLTSNPAIFKQAISNGDIYTSAIKELRGKGLGAEAITEELMLEDVAAAADLLRPVFDKTGGADGFASIEVSPELANDTEKTLQAARAYWQKLNRPNIMIKVPATPAGIPAIQTLLSEGLNVNVTLIFSLSCYQEVMNAYIEALNVRAAKNLPLDSINSVASFFISRNDSWLEKKISALPAEEKEALTNKYYGQVGLAAGFAAYDLFVKTFAQEKFTKLAANGAKKQRILWASSSVKNTKFNPFLYALNLPCKDSVGTHPPALVDAIIKAADFKLNFVPAPNLGEIESLLGRFAVNFESLSAILLNEGVELFADSYRQMLKAVEQRM